MFSWENRRDDDVQLLGSGLEPTPDDPRDKSEPSSILWKKTIEKEW